MYIPTIPCPLRDNNLHRPKGEKRFSGCLDDRGMGGDMTVLGMGTDQIRVELAGVKAGAPVLADLHKVAGLPVTLVEKYSETVGGVLGASDLHDTVIAGLIALGAIFSFLMLAYRGKGLIAAFTTTISLWLLLAAFVLLHAPLSLSAIVAFVLAIGIASDANIIAFERSHERARIPTHPGCSH